MGRWLIGLFSVLAIGCTRPTTQDNLPMTEAELVNQLTLACIYANMHSDDPIDCGQLQ